MNNKHLVFLVLLVSLCAGCSGNLAERSRSETTSPPEVAATDEPTAPLLTADPESAGTNPPQNSLELSGQLYYIGFVDQRQKLMKLDLPTGEEVIIFDPPENAWLNEAAVSPDGSQILLAYAPPPEGSQVQFGFTDLYLMPADATEEPELLLEGAEDSETFFNISWPTEELIYYAHFAPSVDDIGVIHYSSQIERLHYPNGEIEVLVPSAAWPRVSFDGTLLAYVTEENDFRVADADGSNPKALLDPEAFTAVDAPLFSTDNSFIYFSAVGKNPEASSFLDRLLGVEVASAHGVPSDWWRMLLDNTGEPERLTEVHGVGLYGDFDAEGRNMAFSSASGVFVMSPDGTKLTQLREIATIGTIEWVP